MATTLEQKLEVDLASRFAKTLSRKGTVIYWTPAQFSADLSHSNLNSDVDGSINGDRDDIANEKTDSAITVVLIHNMWGNHRILQRHVQLFQNLGYSCATFNLYKASSIKDPHPFGFFDNFKFMHQLWVEQIEDVLNSIGGKKIVFAMSGPAVAAIIAGAKRTDITHLICDSGPFKEVWQCTYRLLTQIWHIPTAPLRAIFTTVSVFLWGPTAYRRSQKALLAWNQSIPIFSIRGVRDPLVFPQNIEGIFKDHKNLNVTVWTIADAHHLDGLKVFPEIYQEKISSFLLKNENS